MCQLAEPAQQRILQRDPLAAQPVERGRKSRILPLYPDTQAGWGGKWISLYMVDREQIAGKLIAAAGLLIGGIPAPVSW